MLALEIALDTGPDIVLDLALQIALDTGSDIVLDIAPPERDHLICGVPKVAKVRAACLQGTWSNIIYDYSQPNGPSNSAWHRVMASRARNDHQSSLLVGSDLSSHITHMILHI